MALWLVMSLVTTGIYVVPALLVEEKQSRTLNAVLTTPAGYRELVLAKAGVGLIYGLLSSGLILALNEGLGNNVGLVIGAVFLGALVLVGLGLLLTLNSGLLFFVVTSARTFEQDTGLSLEAVRSAYPAVVVEVNSRGQLLAILLGGLGLMTTLNALYGYRHGHRLAWRSL